MNRITEPTVADVQHIVVMMSNQEVQDVLERYVRWQLRYSTNAGFCERCCNPETSRRCGLCDTCATEVAD